jgi:hypothetical protein
MESRPFNKATLDNYDMAQKRKESKSPLIVNSNRLIASPNLNSKFSPVVTISKSPSITKKSLGFDISAKNPENKNMDMLLKLSGKSSIQQTDPKNILLKYTTGVAKSETDEGVVVNNVPVSRKNRNPNVANIKEIEGGVLAKKFDEDLQILPAAKYKPDGNTKNKLLIDDIEKISKE